MIRHIKIRCLALILPVWFFAGWIPAAQVAETRRPNIVFMMADDMGFGNVGAYGTDVILTPNIDRLAGEGVRFTDAHSPSAVCQPTRYAILSGQGYWRNQQWGRVQAGTYFRGGEVLLPRLLQESGYATAMFGKWHLGFGWAEQRGDKTDWNAPLTHGPNWAGFDYWFGMANSHAQPPYVYIENDRIYQHDPADPIEMMSYDEARERKLEPPVWQPPGWGVSVGGRAAHEACDLDRLDLEMARRASEWIAARDADQPFFLYIPFFAPHVPFTIAEEFRGTSPLSKRLGRHNCDATRNADYCQLLDHAVGMVLEALEQHGLAENTLVIFTSDNGNVHFEANVEAEFRTNGPWLGQKTDVWEGGHRVPFIARWPGRIPAGVVNDRLLSLTDLYDTFLALADVKKSEGAGIDSINQLPVLLDSGHGPLRRGMMHHGKGVPGFRIGDWVYLWVQDSGGLNKFRPQHRMGFTHSDYDEEGNIRPDAPEGQLYDLASDPAQSTNLYWAESALRDELERVRQAYWADDRRNPRPLRDFYDLLSDEATSRLWPTGRWGGITQAEE